MSRQPEARNGKSVRRESSLLSPLAEVNDDWSVEERGEGKERSRRVRVDMVKGKVASYPMEGDVWKGVEMDAEDEDEGELLPAIVYLWVQRDGPTAVDLVKDHKFVSKTVRVESMRLATSFDDAVKAGGIKPMLRNARWKAQC